MSQRLAFYAFLAVFTLSIRQSAFGADERTTKVLNDRTEVQAEGHWIYNDLPKGFEEATRTGRPMLVVFRCVP